MLKTLRSRQGFTLIELMIVVVIIGILAALAIPRFSQASDRAKEREADGILKQVYTMQEVHRASQGSYTDELQDLIDVGFEEPTTLKHYTWVEGTTDINDSEPPAFSLCLQPLDTETTINVRCINAEGTLSNTTAEAVTP